MINLPLNEKLLNFYYGKSFNNLKTGMDKITPSHFETIKDNEFEIIINKYYNKTYKFTKFKKITIQNKRNVYIPTIRDRLILEYLKDTLNRKYRINYKDRDKIISTIKKKLSYNMDYFVIRLDIKDFFPSVPQNNLLHKLKKNSIFSSNDYHLIKEVLKKTTNGLPQGLSISNSLSEIYLEDVDQQLKKIDQSLNYYSRYVDDILLIFNGKPNDDKKEKIIYIISKILKSFGLTINNDKLIKTPNKQTKEINFEYLGYHFIKDKELSVNVSTKKVEKLIEKITDPFDQYIKDIRVNNTNNINLLIERLNMLTKSHVIIKKDKSINKNYIEFYKLNKIYTGFLQSYKYADNKNLAIISQIIDRTLHKKILSISPLIQDKTQLKKLYSISMYRSYINKTTIPICRFTKAIYIKKILFISSIHTKRSLMVMSFNDLEKLYFKLLK